MRNRDSASPMSCSLDARRVMRRHGQAPWGSKFGRGLLSPQKTDSTRARCGKFARSATRAVAPPPEIRIGDVLLYMRIRLFDEVLASGVQAARNRPSH